MAAINICRGDAIADVDRKRRLEANDPLPPFNDSRMPFVGGGVLGVEGDPRFMANMGWLAWRALIAFIKSW